MALYFIPKYQVPNDKFPVMSKEDIANIEALGNLSGQLKQLAAFLEIPQDDLTERASACAEVLQVLQKFYPKASLTMFGSSANSFGLRGCDLDLLFLPFPGYCNLDHATKEGEREKTKLPDPALVLSGEVSGDFLDKLDEYNHLKFARLALRQQKVGRRANFMPGAKCPILKVLLPAQKTVCDISASNRLVLFNTELLHTFAKLDERVKPLVICLRYWARSLGLIKRSFFSSYSFTLLVIFFLQSLPSPVLPSVKRLIEISGTSRITAGWECSLPTDIKSIPKSKNTLTIGDLMIQFFDFYFHFDFLRFVVSPHHGKALLIEDVKNSMDERMTSFEIRALNIQDPFVLSSNVCRTEKMTVFKLALLTAGEMLKTDKGEKVDFRSLFDPNAYQRALDDRYREYTGGRPQLSFIHLDHECFAKFDSLQAWYEKASEAVYEVLQCGLLMDCEVTDKVIYRRKRKDVAAARRNSGVDGSQTSTPYDLELLVSIQCVLYSRTWIGRRNVQVTSQPENDDLDMLPDSVLGNEHCISRHLVDRDPKMTNCVPVLCFNCECYKHSSPEFKDLIVMLKPITVSREFYQVAAFLSAFIPKTVKKILKSN